MDKASFDSLNKLFVISTSKRNHETLLIDLNFLIVVWDSQPYVISVIPHFAPKVLVPNKYHVLKRFLFLRESSGDRHEGKARPAQKREKTPEKDVETGSRHRLSDHQLYCSLPY